jgi:hypothetical protein
VLKKYVNPNNSLIEFVKQYIAIQDKVMASVSKEQLETVYKETEMYSMNPLELQVWGLYTHNLFSKFQVEMKVKSAYRCDTLHDGILTVSSVRGKSQNMGTGTTMCKQTWVKGHTRVLAASLIETDYYAHT